MAITLAQLQDIAKRAKQVDPSQRPKDMPLTVPLNPKATGKEGFIRVQWSPVDQSDGYQVAISTTANIQSPSIGTMTVMGGLTPFFDYNVGNIALTRYFAVRAFQGFPPRFYSDFCSVVSATSIVLASAGSAEPASSNTTQSSDTTIPAGAGSSGGGSQHVK